MHPPPGAGGQIKVFCPIPYPLHPPPSGQLLVLLLLHLHLVLLLPCSPRGQTDAYAPHFIRRFRQVWQYPLVGGRPIWLGGSPVSARDRHPKLGGGSRL